MMPNTTHTLPLQPAENSSTASTPNLRDANRSVSIPAAGRVDITIRITKSYPGTLPHPKPYSIPAYAGDLTNATNTEHAHGTEVMETVQASMPRDCSLSGQSAPNGTESACENQCHGSGDCYDMERDANEFYGIYEDDKSHGTKQEMALSEKRCSTLSAEGEVQDELFHKCVRSGASTEETAGAMRTVNALKDYKIQLMLLEQQNKKRLMIARAELSERKEEDNDGSDWHDPTVRELSSVDFPSWAALMGVSHSREMVNDLRASASKPYEILAQQDCSLADYERQLILLEQTNKKRLMLARMHDDLIEALSKEPSSGDLRSGEDCRVFCTQ